MIKKIIKFIIFPIAAVLTGIELFKRFYDRKVMSKLKEATGKDVVFDVKLAELKAYDAAEAERIDSLQKSREGINVDEDWHKDN
jgi:hypothetical protein